MLCDRIAVLGAAPAMVKKIISVDIPRPRTMKSMRDPDFGHCVEQIWELLRHDIGDRTIEQRAR